VDGNRTGFRASMRGGGASRFVVGFGRERCDVGSISTRDTQARMPARSGTCGTERKNFDGALVEG